MTWFHVMASCARCCPLLHRTIGHSDGLKAEVGMAGDGELLTNATTMPVLSLLYGDDRPLQRSGHGIKQGTVRRKLTCRLCERR